MIFWGQVLSYQHIIPLICISCDLAVSWPPSMPTIYCLSNHRISVVSSDYTLLLDDGGNRNSFTDERPTQVRCLFWRLDRWFMLSLVDGVRHSPPSLVHFFPRSVFHFCGCMCAEAAAPNFSKCQSWPFDIAEVVGGGVRMPRRWQMKLLSSWIATLCIPCCHLRALCGKLRRNMRAPWWAPSCSWRVQGLHAWVCVRECVREGVGMCAWARACVGMCAWVRACVCGCMHECLCDPRLPNELIHSVTAADGMSCLLWQCNITWTTDLQRARKNSEILTTRTKNI